MHAKPTTKAEGLNDAIFVDKRYRRRGLAETALLGAVDLISRAGGGVVEGYPHVPGEKKMSSSFLYNGTRAMYERCGFDFVRPKGMKNTVMRRTVAPAGCLRDLPTEGLAGGISPPW
ncbi:MAG: GNAT family N-acetyltransferase [Actinomycetia bacterium]|nr:GNAT family N-acetyltransferase [Actinomycetes bacterium]